jgi:hypothetical protein
MPEVWNMRWKEYSDRIVEDANRIDHRPKIWQFDYLDSTVYSTMMDIQSQKLKNIDMAQWNDAKLLERDGKTYHPGIKWNNDDWLSTSDIQTKMIVDYLDPEIVMLGGLHSDRCVNATMKGIFTLDREYFISNRLSYSYKETLAAVFRDTDK